MANRTHLGRQDDVFLEYGLMVLEADPASPTENMTWYNTQEQRFKTHRGGVTRILSESLFSTEQELPVTGVMDGSKFNNFYKTTSTDLTVTFENFFDGIEARLLVKNTGTNVKKVTQITVPSATQMNDGNYFTLKSAKNLENYHVYYNFDGLGANIPVVADSTPVSVTVTQGRYQTSDVTFPAASGITSGQFFELFSANNATNFYVWFNKDGLGGNPGVTNPALAGYTGIQVVITSANTATQVAELVSLAVGARIEFDSTYSGPVCTISTVQFAPADPIVNGNIVGLITTQVSEGASPDDAISVSIKTASALGATSDFDTNIPTTGTFNLTNADFGDSSNPVNIDIPTGFSFVVTTAGSGPITINLPLNTKSVYGEAIASVDAQTQRLFSIVKMQNYFYVTYTSFSI